MTKKSSRSMTRTYKWGKVLGKVAYRADFLRIITYGIAQFGVWVEKFFKKKISGIFSRHMGCLVFSGLPYSFDLNERRSGLRKKNLKKI